MITGLSLIIILVLSIVVIFKNKLLDKRVKFISLVVLLVIWNISENLYKLISYKFM